MNALIYARYSPRPTTEDVESLATQEDRCRAYCAANGLEVFKVIADPEVSARKIPLHKRDGGQELLRLADRNHPVVAYRLDRLFRSLLDGVATIEHWQRRKIVLHIAAESGQSLNTATAVGWMMVVQRLFYAEFEPRLAAERTSDGMRRRQSSGQRMSGRPPYGYTYSVESDKLEPCLRELAIKDIILGLAKEDASERSIARQLNELGYRGRNGKPWHPNVIRKIIDREQVLV
jgi:site-specific DNA recombinase